MPKRILITGASGFVGANLARRALRDGHEVHLLLRPGHQPWRIRGIEDVVQVHRAAVTDTNGLRAAVKAARPEWVFHLAAYGAYASQSDLRQMVDTNVFGSALLVDECAALGVEAYVNAGSSSEYGFKDHPPNESELIQPNSAYAVAKAAACHYAQFVSRSRDFNAITARLWSIYGPFEEPTRLIPTIVVHALHGQLPPLVSPNTARDFVFVDDAVAAMLRIAETRVPRGSVYNICSGIQTSLRDLVAHVQQSLGVDALPTWGTMPSRSWDTDVWIGSPTRTADEIGWRAITPLADGLNRMTRWFQDNPEMLTHYAERILKARE